MEEENNKKTTENTLVKRKLFMLLSHNKENTETEDLRMTIERQKDTLFKEI